MAYLLLKPKLKKQYSNSRRLHLIIDMVYNKDMKKKYKVLSVVLFLMAFLILNLNVNWNTVSAVSVKIKTATRVGYVAIMANLWDGSLATTTNQFPGGSQLLGGVDDYNNNQLPTAAGTYSGSWTQCASSNSYCGTATSSSAWKDNSTGLIWSKALSSSGGLTDLATTTVTWSVANNCVETGASWPYTCTKKTTAKTGCEALSGWYMPTQKQLMSAYIDGAWGKLEGVNRFYWSATTQSNNVSSAWGVNLSSGYVYNGYAKTNSNYVRCVRVF